jgi:hypothetical protein
LGSSEFFGVSGRVEALRRVPMAKGTAASAYLT